MDNLISGLRDGAQMSMGEKFLAGLQVTIFAMIIVFFVLVFLMYIIKFTGKIFVRSEQKKKLGENNISMVDSTDKIISTNVDKSEEIAAVMAAINMISVAQGSRLVVKSITKKQDNWSSSGIIAQMNNRL